MQRHEKEGADIKIDFAQIPDHVKNGLAHATLQAVNEFFQQPGGRILLDREKSLIKEKKGT